jgi:[protein-PII] uridylyltransferase
MGMSESPGAELRSRRTAVLDRADLVGAPLRAELTRVADEWLTERLGDAAGVALVAVGGYGRQEPAVGSDLDLLLLHGNGVDVDELAQSIWYPIWDSGVGLDHSVRTVDQAASVAADDLKAAVGLLDARHVAGDPQLTRALRDQVFTRWRKDARRRLPELVDAVQVRTRRAGELAFLLEPDLKEARGGIRDVTAMTAIAAAWVTDAPDERVRSAYSFLLDVRGELHRRQSRPNDTLVQQEHAPVARALGIEAPDAMLTRLYEAARVIEYATDTACRRATDTARPPRRWRRSGPVRRPLADGVVEQDGEAHLARDARPDDPGLVLRVAAAAAQAGIPVAPHALDRLAAAMPAMPDPWPDGVRDALVATVGAGAAAVPVLESLDQAGLLVRILPEWQQVRCKPQHNAVHRFTVDRHLIEAAVAAAALARRVARPDLLLLSALLHDIGKGWPGDHTDAGLRVVPDILRRMGLQASDIEVVLAVIRHHLLLPDTATRRDLLDPVTIESVAAAVGDRPTLELLHALTEADAAATGPAAWGEWKAGLVSDLVRRTAAALAGEPVIARDPLDADQRALAARGELAVDVRGTRVTVVAPDRRGLLWRWAGVVSLQRVQIRTAVAAQAPGGATGTMAVTVFDVEPRYGRLPDLDTLRADVRAAYDDGLALGSRLTERERAYDVVRAAAAPPRVIWDDGASYTASVVEVRAHDRVGLLYRLTRALDAAGLDVRSATVATLGAEAVDSFYVVDTNGDRVSSELRPPIEAALLAACDEGSASS